MFTKPSKPASEKKVLTLFVLAIVTAILVFTNCKRAIELGNIFYFCTAAGWFTLSIQHFYMAITKKEQKVLYLVSIAAIVWNIFFYLLAIIVS